MSETTERLAQARARMERGSKYAKDLRQQIANNGGLTDAETYALSHAEALAALYHRAGIDAADADRELEEVRGYVERIQAGAGRAPGAPNAHARGDRAHAGRD